jgi:hypothetical protein
MHRDLLMLTASTRADIVRTKNAKTKISQHFQSRIGDCKSILPTARRRQDREPATRPARRCTAAGVSAYRADLMGFFLAAAWIELLEQPFCGDFHSFPDLRNTTTSLSNYNSLGLLTLSKSIPSEL